MVAKNKTHEAIQQADYLLKLAEFCLSEGNPRQALWACGRGLKALPLSATDTVVRLENQLRQLRHQSKRALKRRRLALARRKERTLHYVPIMTWHE